MDEITKIETVDQYDQLFGLETLHPLVNVIDFSKATRSVEYIRMNIGFYSLFLKDAKCGDLRYGRKYYDYQEGTIVCFAPGQTAGVEMLNDVVQQEVYGILFHPDLIRDENDLIYNLLLSIPTAALGGTVEIPTIDSKVKVKIEAGTQPGKVLRLRGKGLPNVNSYGYSTGTGDLLVNVSVYVPETLNKEEKQIMEKMQESDNFKPNLSIKEKIFKKFKNFFD